jgi:hypothetical protein
MDQQIITVLASAPSSPFWFELIKVLIPVAAALFVGGATVWIARRQLDIAAGQLKLSEGQFDLAKGQKEVAEAKLKLDLFQRRYQVYEKTIAIFNNAVQGKVGLVTEDDESALNPFQAFMGEALFLFGQEMKDYLELALKNWQEVWLISSDIRGYKNKARMDELLRLTELKGWFSDQLNESTARFGRYMSVEKWQ